MQQFRLICIMFPIRLCKKFIFFAFVPDNLPDILQGVQLKITCVQEYLKTNNLKGQTYEYFWILLKSIDHYNGWLLAVKKLFLVA